MNHFPSWPQYEDDERAAVARVLASGQVNYWTGSEVRSFEEEFARHVGTAHAIAVANGTVALEHILHAFGIGPGAEVVTTPRTFIATASSVVLRGALPVFADVDPDSQNITAEEIERVITPRTRAIIVVHLAGWPCEMAEITALASSRHLVLIEDCAQANGALFCGLPVGSLADAGAFSFCQDKIITTGGEGGMITTRSDQIWSRAWSFKDHGKNYQAAFSRNHPPGFRWLHDTFGTNGRLTEMQAAIGRVQLRKLPEWSARRRAHAETLIGALENLALLRIPRPPDHVTHAWYKFYTFVKPEALASGWNRDRVMAEINALGVPCFSGSCSEVYREKAFTDAGIAPTERLPVARELGETSLMFLVHPTLGPEHIARTAAVVRDVAKAATR